MHALDSSSLQFSDSNTQPTVMGRPRGDSPNVLVAICDVVRTLGISDTSAAKRAGVSAATISWWKAEHPELRAALGEAREEFRALQVRALMKSAQMEHGRGWRAAAWLLERIFPEDYAMRASEREHHAHLKAVREQREEEAEELARQERETAGRVAVMMEGNRQDAKTPRSEAEDAADEASENSRPFAVLIPKRRMKVPLFTLKGLSKISKSRRCNLKGKPRMDANEREWEGRHTSKSWRFSTSF